MRSEETLGSVLVVGGCGFLGHHIVSHIHESDTTARLSVLDLQTERNRIPSVSYYNGDISFMADVKALLEQIQPMNIRGTHNLVECAQELGTVKAFVNTSSASVVHDNISDLLNADKSLPILHIPEQAEVYYHTNGVVEDIVLAANRKNSRLMTAAIRPAGIFGEGDLVTVASMVKAAETGKYKLRMGTGKNLFDFTCVGNLTQAHVLAAKALLKTGASTELVPEHLRVDGEAFFMTHNEPYPFWDFARAIGAAAGYHVPKEEIWVIPKSIGLAIGTISEWIVWLVSFGKKKPTLSRNAIKFSCMTRTYCIDKAKRRLGYKPTVSMQEGIRRSGEWMVRENKKTQ